MRVGESAVSVGESAIRWLGWASWLIVGLGTGVAFLLPGPSDSPLLRTVVVITLAALFVVLCVRLLVIAERFPARRLSLLFMVAGLGLWSAGSATVTASQTVEQVVQFPAPGEVFYLASYLGMAAFLLLGVPRTATRTVAIWLEAAVVCSATVCLAAFVVLTPVSEAFSRGGLQLLLAILYPLIDLVLAAIVVAQLMLRQRGRSIGTALLVVGFLGLAVADSSFLVTLSSGSYTSNLVLDGIWAWSFAIIGAGACARPSEAMFRPTGRGQGALLVLASSLAILVLALHPSGVIGWCVTVPAIITVVCTGARMVVALREAQGAAEAMRLSLTDELTGLPNRRAVLAAADKALEGDAPLGFMLLDLDGFKDVNDSVGHAVGDVVLMSLGHRLRRVMGPKVMVGRLGGDEFALLVPEGGGIESLEIARRVRAVLKEPLRVETIDLLIDASIGIALREADDVSAIELLRRADIAMYEAKKSRVGALLFDASQDGLSRQKLRRRDELRQAIAENQLVVWYQPQVDARTRQVVALEALVRWQHPVEGLLQPIAFLPDVRRSGLMLALTEVVLSRVIADSRAWADVGFAFRVAMNCAPPELVGDQLLPKLFKALDQAGLPGDCLLVEVTEESFLADPERAREALCELRAHQVQVSIDDYGTGFSSLAYLRDLPVQELKMDRSFVSTIAVDERSKMIVQTTTQMAHALGLRLVAEGVEDDRTASELVPLGVDVFQGYFIARPMPAEEVGPWVRNWYAEHLSGTPSVSPQKTAKSRSSKASGGSSDPGWYRSRPGRH